jgi:Asp-tRNA(Asn)/Glu-tRNA(Gln) amidotransferase A subunit family amidase
MIDTRSVAFASLLLLATAVCATPGRCAVSDGIDIVELTVDSAQDGLRKRRYTARQLTEACLARIAVYNPGYNAIITPNPNALREADEVDRRRAAGEVLGPLAGIPVAVKDTMDVAGLPTTAGWRPLSSRAGGTDLIPEFDSPVVERLRAAGAVILGKTNVPVFSGSAMNANDSWAGPTFNAAAPTRAPGGSSAGTATAVAASFVVLGLGEETGGSIQYPAAWQALAGIKPTFGLVPNTGVVPLGGSTRDVMGPIARTVRDAAYGLDALAGYTPADPKTVAAIGHVPAQGYAAGLTGATLRGKRIGLYGPGWLGIPLSDPTRQLYEIAIAQLKRQGAVVIADPFAGSDFASLAKPTGAWRYDQRGEESVAFDLQNYLMHLGPKAPAHSIAELIALARQDPFADGGAMAYEREQPVFVASLANPSLPPELRGFLEVREHYIATFDSVMAQHHLDAMVLPQAVAEAPPLYSDEIIDSTTVSQINIGGFPGITVPAGYYASGSPFAVMFVGRLWDEARLLQLAYAFEQHTHARRGPELVIRPADLSKAKS